MQIAGHWRLKAQRYRLEGSSCQTCGQLTFPHRPVCPRCIPQQDRINGCARFEIAISVDLPASNHIFDSFSFIRA
jgi:ribosomal protein L32